MANRLKEDEKNEKIIRGLLKLPANRRCINCNNLGPQYVCTNFWTFVCTSCSGIHREFTHRVKSISMAKFTSQEVIALQEGGNERAKEVYLKEWDPQRNRVPDSSNIDRLRDFIKHVYVNRKFTGERNVDRPPRVKLGDEEDFDKNEKGDPHRVGSRSPPYYHRYSERANYGGRNEMRSPENEGNYKKSSSHFEVVDERRRDDRFGNGNQHRKLEDLRLPNVVPKTERRLPNHQKDIAASSPPIMHSTRDKLGDDMPTLRVGDPPKPNGARILGNSGQMQRALSSSSMRSSDGVTQVKGVNSGSLIDFNADPEPPVPETPQHSLTQQSISAPDGENWASFDTVVQQTAPQPPQAVANEITLESAFCQLSVPGSGHLGNMPTLPVSSFYSFSKVNNGSTTMQQQQPSIKSAPNSQFTNPQFSASATGAVNRPWVTSVAPNLQAPLTAPAGPPSQVATSFQEKNDAVVSHHPADAKPHERKELPQDLFASIYPSTLASAPCWQRGPPVETGYPMQYPASMLHMVQTFPCEPASNNPFDLINGIVPVQSPTFPPKASFTGALPNMIGPSVLLRTYSLETPLRWVPPNEPSYSSATSNSPYMMQQVPSNMPQQVSTNIMPTLHQGPEAAFGAVGSDQHLAARFSRPGTENSFGSVGGNPFG